jgi:glycine cleavage system aminomethyltransferase T
MGYPHTPKGVHKHKCPKCLYVWEHQGPATIIQHMMMTDQEHRDMHTCSKCHYKGEETYEIFRTPKDAMELCEAVEKKTGRRPRVVGTDVYYS